MTKYKTILGLLVRDFIPIRYMKWIGKDNDPWRVPESEKDYIWDIRIPEYFTFPTEHDKEVVQKKAKEIMGTCFKNFKGILYKNFFLQNKEPDFDGGQLSKQKDLWQDFKEYRLSDEYLELSRKNKENSLKATNPHKLSSHGYASKMDAFERELEEVERLGIEPKTAN